jgi:hypothetical protein
MNDVLAQGIGPQDLQRLREIAESGRRMPLLGGRHMVAWGGAAALATLIHGGIAAKIITLMMAAAIFTRLPAFRAGYKTDAQDIGNRIERAVWQVGGAFLGLSAISIFVLAMIMVHRSGDARYFDFFAMMPTLTYGVYAIILRTAAETSCVAHLRTASWIALVFALGCILLIGSPWQYILSAMGAITVSVVPGLHLIKLESEGRRDG